MRGGDRGTAARRAATAGSATGPARQPRVAIIGAGFGGIAAAALLRRAGYTDLVLLERGDRVGGVWRDNHYPGCACDIPAPLYSYSFAPNPTWSRRYPPQSEILDYLERCAGDLGLDGCIRFGTEVTSARWDEPDGCWRLDTATGDRIDADVLVPAVGQLSRPAIPALPGIGRFSGPAFHSARWDHGVDLTNARVGVIGTGASAVQFVPHLADTARQVTIFQRSAPWTLPRPDRRYGAVRHALYRRLPAAMRLSRAGVWTLTVVTGLAVTGNPVARVAVGAVSRAQRRWQVRDAALRERVTPDHPLGCKRIVFSNAWLPALCRPNVDVVTNGISEVTADGVRTTDGTTHRFDVLCYATGFTASDFLAPVRVTGRNGQRLDEVWRDGAHAYLGLTVPGFPNMFLMYGPNTNTGNTSVVYFEEAQARYIVQAVRLLAGGHGPLDVRAEVADRYDAWLRDRLRDSVWTACTNWYRTPSGRVVTNWPGSASGYRRRTARLRPDDFQPDGPPAAGVRPDGAGP